LLGLAFAAVAVPLHAQPAAVLDQSQPSGPVYMAGFSQTDLAQSFVPEVGQCVGAGILLQAGQGTTDTVTIELWTALPNVIGATRLAQESDLGTQGEWVDVFWPAVAVTPGQTYYLVFVGNTSLGIAGDTANPYPNGQVFANAGFGSFPNFDYAFRTWAPQENAIPDLGPAGILALGLLLATAGCLLARRLSA